MRIAGIDGCPGGWLVAEADAGDIASPKIRIVPAFADILDGPDTPSIVAVDMPIGLPGRIEGPGRPAEQAVRPLLGTRRSSVFSIPARDAVYAESGPFNDQVARVTAHGRACARARALSAPPKGMSIQAFGILPKIREIDGLLRERPAHRDRVREIHPELAFRLLKGRPLDWPKKTAAGKAERRALLFAAGLGMAAVDGSPPRGAGTDDLLDALVGLVAARHIAAGQGCPFPDPPIEDAFGIPIAIWGWHPSVA